jgi:uncharacterized membrane protein YdjX (TVP38/TMEM64 family)
MFPRRPAVRLALLVVLVAALAGAVVVLGVPAPDRLAAEVSGLGPLGPAVAVVASACLLIALVPRSVLAAGAGLVFGPLNGGLYVLAGAALAALAAFAAGRALGRDFVASRARLTAIDAWLTRRGVVSVALMRILPVAPFGLVSYGFGTTGIRVGSYLLGTALGAAPSTFVYASLGDNALDPGSPGFVVSIAAAGVLAAGSAAAAAFLRRRDRQAATACDGAHIER